MKKLSLFLSSVLVCLSFSSCVDSTSSTTDGPTKKAAKKKVLDFSEIGHININNQDFSFSGDCSGLNGASLSYTLETKVEEGETAVSVAEGKVECTDGSWEVSGIEGSALSEGAYSLRVSVAGLDALTETIYKDLVAPEVSFEALAPSSKEGSVILTGTCSESGTVVYDLLDDQDASLGSGEVSCSYVAANDNSWTVGADVSGLSDGTIRVKVTLKDRAQNPSSEMENSFNRDTTPPTLTLLDNPINSHNQNPYSLSGTCGENGGAVSLTLGGNSLSGTVTCAAGAWEKTGIDASASSGNEVAVIVTHQDEAGNEARVEGSMVRDVQAPAITGSLEVPIDGTYSSGSFRFFCEL